jgi:hypothetical protein
MRAIFKSVWVRKLIGKLGVPYNRRFQVQRLSHPQILIADLSLAAAEINVFHIQSVNGQRTKIQFRHDNQERAASKKIGP